MARGLRLAQAAAEGLDLLSVGADFIPLEEEGGGEKKQKTQNNFGIFEFHLRGVNECDP